MGIFVKHVEDGRDLINGTCTIFSFPFSSRTCTPLYFVSMLVWNPLNRESHQHALARPSKISLGKVALLSNLPDSGTLRKGRMAVIGIIIIVPGIMPHTFHTWLFFLLTIVEGRNDVPLFSNGASGSAYATSLRLHSW